MNISLNRNLNALNGLRELSRKDGALSGASLKIASGDKIGSFSADARHMQVSETLKYTSDAAKAAGENADRAEQVLLASEAGLNEVQVILKNIRQLAIQASNESAYDEFAKIAMQAEVDQAVAQVRRIADNTSYATKKLLNGEKGVKFFSHTPILTVEAADERTASSFDDGHRIDIVKDAEKASIASRLKLDSKLLDSQVFSLKVFKDGKETEFSSTLNESPKTFISRLNSQFSNQSIDLLASINEAGMLNVESVEYGSAQEFRISSDMPNMLDAPWFGYMTATGSDIEGEINGIEAVGSGRTLSAREGTAEEGLKIRFNGLPEDATTNKTMFTGFVSVSNNAIGMQLDIDGEGYEKLSLRDFRPEAIGAGVENESGFKSLAEVNVLDFKSAQDSLKVLDKSITEIALERAKIGAFQKERVMPSGVRSRQNSDGLESAYAALRDTDYAESLSEMAKIQIGRDAGVSILSQINKSGSGYLQLLA